MYCSCFVVVDACSVKRQQLHAVESLPSDIDCVTDALEHALLAIYPRPRYLVGRDALIMAVLAMLPEFVGDWVFARRLQLPACVLQ